MAYSMNKVILLGNLGKDAETKFTQSGVACTKFSIATERSWLDKQRDEWMKETDWHNVILWRGDKIAPYLVKGSKVCVEGRIQTRSYEDKDGVKKYVTEIVADSVILCGGGSKSEDSQEPVSQPRRAAPQPQRAQEPDFGGGFSDDDVPF